MNGSLFTRFLRPKLNKIFLIRLILISLIAYGVFGYVLIPLRIQGRSMEPTYHNGGFNFCWRLSYLSNGPKRFDVVAIRLAGRRIMLLKRIVGLPGETVSFNKGILHINDQPMTETYVRFQSDWDMTPVKVASKHLFVIGDNRGAPMEQHQFGLVERRRLVGEVLW